MNNKTNKKTNFPLSSSPFRDQELTDEQIQDLGFELPNDDDMLFGIDGKPIEE